jgi:alpha-beta hydrolase superfamily lysophospholipase
MGGLIALRLLMLKPEIKFASATISAPLLEVAFPVPAWKKGLAYGLSRIYGSLQLDSALDPRGLSHDPDLVECYRSDRLVHSKATPKFFVSLEEAMADTRARTQGILPPTLFLFPQEDVIVSMKAESEFAEKLEHPQKKIVPLEGYKHEAFNEGGEFPKERFFQEFSTWIQEHSSKG